MNRSQKVAGNVLLNSSARKTVLVSLLFLFQTLFFAEAKAGVTQTGTAAEQAKSLTTQGTSTVASGKAATKFAKTDSVASDSTSLANSGAGDVKPEGENVVLEVGISVGVILVIVLLTWKMSSGPRKPAPSNKGETAKNG